jgi:hypothetical protein
MFVNVAHKLRKRVVFKTPFTVLIVSLTVYDVVYVRSLYSSHVKVLLLLLAQITHLSVFSTTLRIRIRIRFYGWDSSSLMSWTSFSQLSIPSTASDSFMTSPSPSMHLSRHICACLSDGKGVPPPGQEL